MKHQTVILALGQSLSHAERRYILATLTACDGNQSKCARTLKVNRNTLRAKLKAYGAAK